MVTRTRLIWVFGISGVLALLLAAIFGYVAIWTSSHKWTETYLLTGIIGVIFGLAAILMADDW